MSAKDSVYYREYQREQDDRQENERMLARIAREKAAKLLQEKVK